jgi:hypothetical protein
MRKYPMTEPIARREYSFHDADGPTSAIVEIGRPAVMPDTPHEDWYCPWSVTVRSHVWEHWAAGVDQIQALLLAFSGLRADLLALGRKGKLTWLDSENVGIELVGPAV